MINGKTALVGLLGEPVSHSLSPIMHNEAFSRLGLDWCYLAMPCQDKDLKVALKALRALNCQGLNITIPHKQAVAALCDELSPIAKKLGAVNTLLPRSEGGWIGTNTDVEGFLAPLKRSEKKFNGLKAAVIGCGGSARAVVAGLEELKLKEITIIGRNEKNLKTFLNEQKKIFSSTKASFEILNINTDSKKDLINLINEVDIIVNATPVGMKNQCEKNNIPLGEATWTNLKSSLILYDLIYSPRPTAWLDLGAKNNLICIDGLEMLLEQGAASLRLWSGIKTVPLEAMKKSLETALRN